MKINDKEAGFSYIETIISMVILVVGILGALCAMTFGIVSVQDAEKKTKAKEIAASTVESIFAVRDMKEAGSIHSWDTLQTKTPTNNGIFLDDWTPVRENPGADGVYGTADDACSSFGDCVSGDTMNNSPILKDFERKIEIKDINENGAVRKRLVEVTVRYYVENLARDEKVSSIVANMPFD